MRCPLPPARTFYPASRPARALGRRRAICAPLCCFFLLLFLAPVREARAERLPLRTYTTADGLAHNVIKRVVRDSRGFLWFCAREGLSRFDGYGFTNYGVAEGLPGGEVNDLLETRAGIYWLATAGGLVRFNPAGRPPTALRPAPGAAEPAEAMFSTFVPDEGGWARHATALLEDRSGALWVATLAGLYRLEEAQGAPRLVFVDVGLPDRFESRTIFSLLEDRRGALWIGTANGLYRRTPDGLNESYASHPDLPDTFIHSLLEDDTGRIWVGTRFGWLFRLDLEEETGRILSLRAYAERDGLLKAWINQLFQASDGSLWAGSNTGLIRFLPTPEGDFRFRVYAAPHGLPFHEVESIAEDRNGNLWLGILHGGAAKLTRSGFSIYDQTDGLAWATGLFETRAGELIVVGATQMSEWSLNRFDGERFVSVRPPAPPGSRTLGWGWNQVALEDRAGEWWVATRAGLFRYPRAGSFEQLARTPPRAVYTARDGLASDVVLRLFEDSRGDIWIATVGEGRRNGLSRWERRSDSLHHYAEGTNGLPSFERFYVSSFAEDRAGNVWLGFSGDGGLARYREGGFTLYTGADGLPGGQFRNLFVDSVGRLWATNFRGGLCRLDDPTAERPAFFTYTTAHGLSSNTTSGITEDLWGRIYVGTGRGIDRLDPTTGSLKHYTTADGLPLTEMHGALRDRRGTLWFSYGTGLARLDPVPDQTLPPPPVLIMALQIAGQPRPLSALGEREIASLELASDENQIEINFVALGYSPGEGLRYQYLLEGAQADWSQPTELRTVNFARLAPGSYRFLVRAVNADGAVSEQPASFSFTIRPPVWQRWWFLALAALALGAIAYAAYRYRVARLIEVERLRTRIATDLHDDIGANLTKIAILSEVARQPRPAGNGGQDQTLASIASISRESVAAMSDIVWAINPQRDSLRDLVRRMRRHADELFTPRGVRLEFRAPSSDQEMKLGAHLRRDLFLIFKEAVNNVARHSDCRRVEIDLQADGSQLQLRITDDGAGFDPAAHSDGDGLASMRRRAAELGGTLEFESGNGHGTTILLSLPRAGSRRRWRPTYMRR